MLSNDLCEIIQWENSMKIGSNQAQVQSQQWQQGMNLGSHLGNIDKNGNYPPETKQEKKSMLKEVSNDIRNMIRENKSIIYTILFLLILDKFFFNGAFKAKLSDVMHKLVGKVETKLHEGLDKNVDNKA